MTTDRKPGPSVLWLTPTAWLSLVVFATTSALIAVSLRTIGDDLGIDFELKGLLAQVRSLMLAFSAFAAGYAGDRLGKKRLLGLSMMLVAVSLLWIGSATAYREVVLGMLILGAGLGCLEALVSPLVAELHPRNVATHLGLLHAFFPAGFAIVSVLAGLALTGGVPWQTAFRVAALPAAVVGLMYMVGAYPGEGAGQRPAPLRVVQVLRNRTFYLLALAMMLTAGCEGTLLFWAPNFIETAHSGTPLVGGYVVAGFTVAMAIGRLGTSVAVRRVSLRRIMVYGALCGAAVSLVFASAGSVYVCTGALFLCGLFSACFWPSILALTAERVARGSSLVFAMMSVAGIIGFGVLPWLVGLTADAAEGHCASGLGVGLLLVPVAFVASAAVLRQVFRPPPEPLTSGGEAG